VTSTLHNPGQGLFPKQLVFATDSPAAQTWNYVQPDPGRNYIYQWNFNVQRQVGANTSITVAYLGSRAYHSPFQLDDINTVFPFNTSAGWLFPNPVGSGCILPVACGVVSSTTNAIEPGQLIKPNIAQIQNNPLDEQGLVQRSPVGSEQTK
jgi:hypothetical protein